MERYKICPSCGKKYPTNVIECIECEIDLTRTNGTDEKAEKVNPIIENDAPIESVELVRICECGAKNPPNARKCLYCGEDISDITPAPDDSEKPKAVAIVLSSLDGQYAFKITDDRIEVGRERKMSEYLFSKSYVSRCHAVFTVSDERLYIENVSGTNYTYVNNMKISGKTELHDGDEIGLGGTSVGGNRQDNAAYFQVRIGSCM